MTCTNHSDRAATVVCAYKNIGYCDDCCECPRPKIHCKFRQSCLVWECYKDRLRAAKSLRDD